MEILCLLFKIGLINDYCSFILSVLGYKKYFFSKKIAICYALIIFDKIEKDTSAEAVLVLYVRCSLFHGVCSSVKSIEMSPYGERGFMYCRKAF